MHHVLDVLAAELVCLAGGQHADASCGQRDRINSLKSSAQDCNIKTEPVTLIKPSGGIETDGSRQRSFKVVSGNSQDALAAVLRQGIAANQRIVEVLALKRHGMSHGAQLH